MDYRIGMIHGTPGRPPGPPDIREEVGNVSVEVRMELTCPG